MTTSVEYPSGAPAWLDLTVPDVGRAAGFYGELLGWEFDTGPYTTALLDGERVAGLSAAADPAGPAYWTAHLATPDLGGSLEAAAGLGGRVLSGPEDVAGLGTRAVVREPAGTEFALWLRGSLGGAEAFGVPGAPIWAEATSADVPATADFLVRLFGYEAERIADAEYVTLYSGGSPVCGVYAGAAERTASGRGAWLCYLVVRDADRTSERAVGLGGAVLRPAGASGYGRWALIADPFGARFAAMEVPNGD
ncbi:VOC family protein [Nocardiopsis sp. CNT-189]|uniref:VOC family protein n=1 Tax=Nocardiopsis oceanisediminis TaxID=2816862 RepID=UPI003B2EC653